MLSVGCPAPRLPSFVGLRRPTWKFTFTRHRVVVLSLVKLLAPRSSVTEERVCADRDLDRWRSFEKSVEALSICWRYYSGKPLLKGLFHGFPIKSNPLEAAISHRDVYLIIFFAVTRRLKPSGLQGSGAAFDSGSALHA